MLFVYGPILNQQLVNIVTSEKIFSKLVSGLIKEFRTDSGFAGYLCSNNKRVMREILVSVQDAKIIHYELPNDPETFVHRSGRTGRAGKEGTVILMFTSSQRRTIRSLERDVGCKFEFISPPSVEEVLESSAEQVVATLSGVHPESVEFFTPTAQKLIEEQGTGTLAAAIAQLSGFSQPPSSRSLITHEKFYGFISPKLNLVNMKVDFLNRNVNEGFSSGERKCNEILQLENSASNGQVPMASTLKWHLLHVIFQAFHWRCYPVEYVMVSSYIDIGASC